MLGRFPSVSLVLTATIALPTGRIAEAAPGTHYVVGSGTAKSQDRTEAAMAAHDNAKANMEHTCDSYASNVNGETSHLSEARTASSTMTRSGEYFYATVNMNAKCVVVSR